MDDIVLKRREVFFNNLVMLGLDKESLKKKHGISFHKDMFDLPNKQGFEIVTFFLFSKLSSATGKDYNIPWPLSNKEYERTFQKKCYSHLMDFSQENCVNFPRIVPSLLSTFGGDRFYELYFAFSSHVLYKTIKKTSDIPISVPSISRENYNTAKDILQLSTVLNMKKFRDTEAISYQSHKIWIKFAKNLQESLGKLKRLLKFYEESLKKKKTIVLSLYPMDDGSFNLSKVIETCLECLKPILKQRKNLDKFLSSEEKYWLSLRSEVGEKAENLLLNGEDYMIQVTEALPEEYVKELKKTGCLSSDENGKLSVERFIKISMAYLTYIIDLLKKVNLNELHQACVVENPAAIKDDLECIKKFNKKLSDEVLPDIEENIKKLKIITGYNDIQEHSELGDLFCPLPVQSFDVDAVKQRTSHFDPSLEKIYYSASKERQCSKNIDADFFLSEKNPIDYSSTSFTNQNLVGATFSFTSNISGQFIDSSRLVEKNSSDYPNKSNLPPADPSASSQMPLSSLDDLDFSGTTEFKMRESWLEEESLHTMTLPDSPFYD